MKNEKNMPPTAIRICKSLEHKLLDKNKMGESKHEAKRRSRREYMEKHGSLRGWNPAEADGIYARGTMATYLEEMSPFSTYCAAHGAKRVGDVTAAMAERYLLQRHADGASAWTVSTASSAINKALGYHLSPAALGLPARRKARITRSRVARKHDTRDFSAFADQISFAKGTGVRRKSVTAVRPRDCLRSGSGEVIGVRVKEKGGRERIAPVLNAARREITRIVDAALARKGTDAPVFDRYDIHIDNHRFRAEYCAALLHQLEGERKAGKPLFGGTIDPRRYIRIRGKDAIRGPRTQGHDTDLLAAVSGAMGHNRIDVILGHYLYLY